MGLTVSNQSLQRVLEHYGIHQVMFFAVFFLDIFSHETPLDNNKNIGGRKYTHL